MKNTIVIFLITSFIFLAFNYTNGGDIISNKAILVGCCNVHNPWSTSYGEDWNVFCIKATGERGDYPISRLCCQWLWLMNDSTAPSSETICKNQWCPKE